MSSVSMFLYGRCYEFSSDNIYLATPDMRSLFGMNQEGFHRFFVVASKRGDWNSEENSYSFELQLYKRPDYFVTQCRITLYVIGSVMSKSELLELWAVPLHFYQAWSPLRQQWQSLRKQSGRTLYHYKLVAINSKGEKLSTAFYYFKGLYT